MTSPRKLLHSTDCRRRFLLTLAVLLSSMLAIGCPAQTNEEIVANFFPQRLIDDPRRILVAGTRASRLSAFVLADLNGTGSSDFIVAAYSNGALGAVRVLRRGGGTATLADEPQLRMIGGRAAVRLIDLDGDNRPEVVASFSDAKGYMSDWVFKWNGMQLQFIGPSSVTPEGDTESIIGDADFVDIDGDGKLEIVDGPSGYPVPEGDPVPPDKIAVYKLDGTGGYVPFKTLVFFGVFERTTGTPISSTRTFIVDRSGVAYLLNIKNGDAIGQNRTSSATIRINGVQVVGPDELNQQVGEITKTITVQLKNTLVAEVAAKPSARVIVMIEKQPN